MRSHVVGDVMMLGKSFLFLRHIKGMAKNLYCIESGVKGEAYEVGSQELNS